MGMDLSQVIARCQSERGLQSRLAGAAGLSHSTVSRIVEGKVRPLLSTAVSLVKALEALDANSSATSPASGSAESGAAGEEGAA